jgi:hypothetical protein
LRRLVRLGFMLHKLLSSGIDHPMHSEAEHSESFRINLIRRAARRFARTMFGSSTHSGQSARGVVPKGSMKQFVPGNPIVVEAGAHVGSDTVEMSKIWPG